MLNLIISVSNKIKFKSIIGSHKLLPVAPDELSYSEASLDSLFQ